MTTLKIYIYIFFLPYQFNLIHFKFYNNIYFNFTLKISSGDPLCILMENCSTCRLFAIADWTPHRLRRNESLVRCSRRLFVRSVSSPLMISRGVQVGGKLSLSKMCHAEQLIAEFPHQGAKPIIISYPQICATVSQGWENNWDTRSKKINNERSWIWQGLWVRRTEGTKTDREVDRDEGKWEQALLIIASAVTMISENDWAKWNVIWDGGFPESAHTRVLCHSPRHSSPHAKSTDLEKTPTKEIIVDRHHSPASREEAFVLSV